MLAGEHLSRSAEAVGNLIEYQQRTMFIARCSDLLPKTNRRDNGRASGGLCDHGRDVALFAQDILDIIGAFQRAVILASPKTSVTVRRWNVLSPGQQRADVFAKNAFSTHGDGIERGAVERIPHRDRLEPARRHPRQF